MNEPLAIRNLLAGRLSAGIVQHEGIALRSQAGLHAHLEREIAALRLAHAATLPPGYAQARRLYRSLGIDPTRHRPSSEALWRRLRDRGDFPRVHPLVDLTNLLSLRFGVSYGLYDMAKIEPPLQIALGEEQDRYEGIGKEVLSFAGKIVLRDTRGAFGNPSADSRRACIDPQSRDILQVLFFPAADPRCEEIVAASLAAFSEHFAALSSRSRVV